MRKKLTNIIVIMGATALLAGCGNKIPEMTQQQEELIVEYAAGTVLKYDKNYESKLVELTLEENTENETGTQENAPAIKEEEAQTDENAASEVPVIDNTEDVANTVASIEEFLQLDFVRTTYTGYETCDIYPGDDAGSDVYFIMNATEGNKLLVVKFFMENVSGEEREVNIAQSNVRFKIAVNGTEKNALTTMLLNDLAYYSGRLAAGEGVELVLICEVPDEQSGEISSLALEMTNVDNTATLSLY